MTDSAAGKAWPYKVLPDPDNGGWFVWGPTDQPKVPKWARTPAREVAEANCEAMNLVYAAGRASRDGIKEALEEMLRFDPDGDLPLVAFYNVARAALAQDADQ